MNIDQIVGYELVVLRGPNTGMRKRYETRASARRAKDRLDAQYGAICCSVKPVYAMDPVQESLRALVELIVEKKVREADVSDGSKVPHGSSKHIKDLESRIESLSTWRDREKKGSDRRANYARIIQRLKGELASAKRSAAKRKEKKR